MKPGIFTYFMCMICMRVFGLEFDCGGVFLRREIQVWCGDGCRITAGKFDIQHAVTFRAARNFRDLIKCEAILMQSCLEEL